MKKETKLYENIMDKLDFEPSLDASSIAISVKDDGIVTLGGEVSSYAEKCIAEEAIKKIRGVRGIADELRINLATPYVRSDVDIIKSALDALKWNFFVPENQIKVVVENSGLTLSGQVDKYYQKEAAEKAVQDIVGLIGVANNITVRPIISTMSVKLEIIKEFERNARIDANNIEVEVHGGVVTLKGKVKNFDEDKEARHASWAVPGVCAVIDQLSIN